MSENCSVSRREFLTRSGQAAAGMLAAGALSSCRSPQPAPAVMGKTIGSNGRVNMAFVGVRSRGQHLFESFGLIDGVRIAALCDVDGNVLAERAKEVEEKFGYRPLTYMDERKMLENRDIDAVVIATPNFWHALGTIWACQAGKHVYVEKPCCHNLFEGRKMVEAAQKYGCIVAVGCQNRSIETVRQAMEFLHSGGIGEVYLARGLCYKPRGTIGLVPDGLGTGPKYEYFVWGQPGINYDAAYMAKVDYEMWQGPAPKRPFNYNRFHYNWHWNWTYGSGDIGNQGPHQWDLCRWGLNKQEHPVRIVSDGGYYGKPCAQETPNVQTAQMLYADGKMIEFEVRGLSTNKEDRIGIGNLFYGTKGWLHLNGGTWQSYFGHGNEKGPGAKETDASADPMNPAGSGDFAHFQNFVEALKSNDVRKLTCPIEEGYMSSSLPLLANIAYRLDRKLTFDGARERFAGDREADRMLTRDYRRPYVVEKTV